MEVLNMNVGGVYLWTYLLGIPAIYGVFYLFNSWWETRQALKRAGGDNILVLFHKVSGKAYFKWCIDDRGELSPADMKGYDQRAKGLAKSSIGKIKAEKQAFGWYFLLPDHVFKIPYPFNHPKTEATLVEFVENYPAPRVTCNLEKWSPEEYKNVTSALAMASKDTTDIEAIISQAAGIEEKLGALADVPEKMKTQQLILYGIAGGVAITLIMLFTYGDKITKIAAQYGLSWIQGMFGG